MSGPGDKPVQNHKVGYGSPPLHTRFVKGRSGNPRGRPLGRSAESASELALKELYRRVQVRDGDRIVGMPALQAVLRSLVAQAAKGNVTAQRALFQMACALEKAIGEQNGAAKQKGKASDL